MLCYTIPTAGRDTRLQRRPRGAAARTVAAIVIIVAILISIVIVIIIIIIIINLHLGLINTPLLFPLKTTSFTIHLLSKRPEIY